MTLHVDRTALDARLFEQARALGTEFVWERVTDVDAEGDRVTGLHRRPPAAVSTPAGTSTPAARPGSCRARWASRSVPTGGRRSASGPTSTRRRCTTARCSLSTTATSISAGSGTSRFRRIGPASASCSRPNRTRSSARRVFRRRHPARGVVAPPAVRPPARRTACARGREHVLSAVRDDEVCGANWFMVGEAAVDARSADRQRPDVRHAARKARVRGDPGSRRRAIALWTSAAASTRACVPARSLVQRAHRERGLPASHALGLGFQTATYIYTLFAFFMNALHARFDPRGGPPWRVSLAVLRGARMWIAGWTLVARAALWSRGALYGER